jgi:hypothetical protein
MPMRRQGIALTRQRQIVCLNGSGTGGNRGRRMATVGGTDITEFDCVSHDVVLVCYIPSLRFDIQWIYLTTLIFPLGIIISQQ